MASVTRLGPGGYPIAARTALRNLTLQAASGSYTITGSSATLLRSHILQASPGSYTITGASASLLQGHVVKASPGAYTIVGASANLVYTKVNLFGMAPLGALPIGTPPQFLFEPFVPPAPLVTRDIDAVLTKKQLHELRRRLAREREQRGRNLEKEGRTRAELRSTLESFFKVAEPEQVKEIKEKLPVVADAAQNRAKPRKTVEFTQHIDWPKLYDDRALMEGLTWDLSKILADHLERQRFEREEDDLAILMLA